MPILLCYMPFAPISSVSAPVYHSLHFPPTPLWGFLTFFCFILLKKNVLRHPFSHMPQPLRRSLFIVV
jgi:hypothetical protein